jgi:hypothetical protein
MRIDPTQLFTPFQPSEADRQSARAFLCEHLGPEENPSEGMIEHTLALQNLPAAWYFEHDGWWMGGFGGFPDMPELEIGSDHSHRTFLCKDRVGWLVQQRAFKREVNRMRAEGLTDPRIFLERLTNGLTPQRFMERFGSNKAVLGPYERPMADDGQVSLGNTFTKGALGPDVTFKTRLDFLAKIATGLASISGDNAARTKTANRDNLSKMLVAQANEQAEQTHMAMLRALNPAALTAAANARFDDLRLVSWLTLGNSERRIQALSAHPGTLGGLVLRHWLPVPSKAPVSHHSRLHDLTAEDLKQHRSASLQALRMGSQGIAAIGQRIDDGQSWYEEAAQWLTRLHAKQGMRVDHQYTQELLRGFQRIPRLPQEQRPTKETLDHIGCLHPHLDDTPSLSDKEYTIPQAATAVWLAGMLQVADIPRNDSQWAAAREMLLSMMGHDRLDSTEAFNEQAARPCLSLTSLRNYRRCFQGLTQPLVTDSPDWLLPFNLLHELSDTTRDSAGWVANSVGLPTSAAYLLLDARFTLQQWQRAQRVLHGYHHQFTQRQAAKKAESMALLEKDVALWPLGDGMPQTSEHHGVVFHALANPSALLREGEYMGHCVAGYSPACFAGSSRIYSVTHQHTGERATLELVWADRMGSRAQQGGRVSRVSTFAYPTPQLSIRQLRGFHNGPVTPALIKAAEAFLAACRAEESLAPWPVMETPNEWRGEQHEPDDLFYQQVRQWMAHQHPSVYAQLTAQQA